MLEMNCCRSLDPNKTMQIRSPIDWKVWDNLSKQNQRCWPRNWTTYKPWSSITIKNCKTPTLLEEVGWFTVINLTAFEVEFTAILSFQLKSILTFSKNTSCEILPSTSDLEKKNEDKIKTSWNTILTLFLVSISVSTAWDYEVFYSELKKRRE